MVSQHDENMQDLCNTVRLLVIITLMVSCEVLMPYTGSRHSIAFYQNNPKQLSFSKQTQPKIVAAILVQEKYFQMGKIVNLQCPSVHFLILKII